MLHTRSPNRRSQPKQSKISDENVLLRHSWKRFINLARKLRPRVICEVQSSENVWMKALDVLCTIRNTNVAIIFELVHCVGSVPRSNNNRKSTLLKHNRLC